MSKEFLISPLPPPPSGESGKLTEIPVDSNSILTIRSLRDTEHQKPEDTSETYPSLVRERVSHTEVNDKAPLEAQLGKLHVQAIELVKGFVQIFGYAAAEKVTHPREWGAVFRSVAGRDTIHRTSTNEFIKFSILFPKIIDFLSQKATSKLDKESLDELYLLSEGMSELFTKLQSNRGQEREGRKIQTLAQALDEYIGNRRDILQRVLSGYPEAFRREAIDTSVDLEGRLARIEVLEAEEAQAREAFERVTRFDAQLEDFFRYIVRIKDQLARCLQIQPVPQEKDTRPSAA